MGLIVDRERGIETVGDLIKSLQRFPEDMPAEVGMDETVEVYRDQPTPDEDVIDPRGRICIEGEF